MKSLLEKNEFSEEDILSLIKNEVEESTYLDFKGAPALAKSEGKKKELSKDIAAFANSDGGVIIYGINEENHKAHSLSFVDGNEFTKEWIEQLINSTIQRHIPELRIFPIRFDSNIEKTVYVVQIPKSTEAPHISRDKRFYRRYNFESVFMEEYEVRELYGRKTKSKLLIGDYNILILNSEHPEFDEDYFKFQMEVSIINDGDISENDYKLNLYFNGMDDTASINWSSVSGDYDSTRFHELNRYKISTSNSPTIYPEELVDVMQIMISIDKKSVKDTLENVNFEIKLLYSNGEDELTGDLKHLIKKE